MVRVSIGGAVKVCVRVKSRRVGARVRVRLRLRVKAKVGVRAILFGMLTNAGMQC